MDLIVIMVLGIATSFNLIVLKYKLEHGRNADAFLDAGVLALLAYVFGGTITGLAIASVTSFIVSVYLLFFPPVSLKRKSKRK